MSMLYNKKDDDAGSNLFANIDKSIVMQEARVFNESPLVTRKCCYAISKILYLLYTGTVFNSEEATNVFFSVTKAFQSKDPYMRRMVYLVVKELSGLAKDIIILHSSLSKDVASKTDPVYRANAIRALVSIVEAPNVQSIERVMKEAIIDSDEGFSSAALVSAIHIYMKMNKDMVKRWQSEIQQQLSKKNSIVSYHALGLMYLIKQADKMAVFKLAQSMENSSNPLTASMFLRIYGQLMDATIKPGSIPIIELKPHLHQRYRREMIAIEAARAILAMDDAHASPHLVQAAVASLQTFITSTKDILRFAAIRTLNDFAVKYPLKVSNVNHDIENLIGDTNRSVATFAVTTLLQTGDEQSVDRLLKQLNAFIGEMSDDFKIIVVKAIKSLCIKFPAKYKGLLNFLGPILLEKGCLEYKRAIVYGLFDIVRHIPVARDDALHYLCDSLEDCEYPKLSAEIVSFLAVEGPKSSNPSTFITFIYNRLLLEQNAVRMSAIAALAEFGRNAPAFKNTVQSLLKRFDRDEDEEVRERATLFGNVLNDAKAIKLMDEEPVFSLPDLEAKLQEYLNNPALQSIPFDMSVVPLVSKDQLLESLDRQTEYDLALPMLAETVKSAASAAAASASVVVPDVILSTQITELPMFKNFGPLFASSHATPLTEPETEYVVTCARHIFKEFIVFQFSVTNTIESQVLERVRVVMNSDNDALAAVASYPIERLGFNSPESSYVVYQYDSSAVSSLPICSFACDLKFSVREIDVATGEADEAVYEDSYQLEDLDLSIGHFISPRWLQWEKEWNVRARSELVETFSSPALKSIPAAIRSLLDLSGCAPCNNSDIVASPDAVSHTLMLSGIAVCGGMLLVRVRMAAIGGGVTMEIAVRSDDASLSDLFINSIQ